MNILFVHQNFPAQFKHLAPALVEGGNTVMALTLRDIEEVYWKGVKVIPYKIKKQPSKDIHPWAREVELKILRAAACLEASVNLNNQGFVPDVIIAHHGWGESAFLKDLWPESRLGIYCEYYYRDNNSDLDFDSEFPKPSIESIVKLKEGNGPVRIKNINNLLHMSIADGALSPTEWQANTFPESFKKKIRVIHDGIDTEKIKPDPDANIILNNAVCISRKDEVLTFVNRDLEPMRGYHIFMRSLPKILKARAKLRVLIVGSDGVSYGRRPSGDKSWRDLFADEVRPKLTDDEWERVHFVGRLPYEHFIKVLQVSTVHIYLTYPFVLSWSLLEAMSAGCTLVASDTDPVKEVLVDGHNARLVHFFDVGGIADTVIELLENSNERFQLGENARSSVKERFDLKHVCLPQQIDWVEKLIVR